MSMHLIGYIAVVAEWLRRQTRNLLGSARAGSNPADCATVLQGHIVGMPNIKQSHFITLHPEQQHRHAGDCMWMGKRQEASCGLYIEGSWPSGNGANSSQTTSQVPAGESILLLKVICIRGDGTQYGNYTAVLTSIFVSALVSGATKSPLSYGILLTCKIPDRSMQNFLTVL